MAVDMVLRGAAAQRQNKNNIIKGKCEKGQRSLGHRMWGRQGRVRTEDVGFLLHICPKYLDKNVTQEPNLEFEKEMRFKATIHRYFTRRVRRLHREAFTGNLFLITDHFSVFSLSLRKQLVLSVFTPVLSAVNVDQLWSGRSTFKNLSSCHVIISLHTDAAGQSPQLHRLKHMPVVGVRLHGWKMSHKNMLKLRRKKLKRAKGQSVSWY